MVNQIKYGEIDVGQRASFSKMVVTNQRGEVVIDGKAAVMVMDIEER